MNKILLHLLKWNRHYSAVNWYKNNYKKLTASQNARPAIFQNFFFDQKSLSLVAMFNCQPSSCSQTKKSFRIRVNPNQIWIVITLFRLYKQKTEFSSVLNRNMRFLLFQTFPNSLRHLSLSYLTTFITLFFYLFIFIDRKFYTQYITF